jgi:7-cyano-7-deazaguanine synthase
MHPKALVLFSGGQDSTTCLAHALTHCEHVETMGIDYGQRHRVEMQARLNVLEQMHQQFAHWAPKLGEDHVVDLRALGQISDTSLTRNVALRMEENGLPNTFVPARNLIFLSFAAAVAYRRGLNIIVTGVCETDYSGYPDCRDDTIKAMQVALRLGMDYPLRIDTPLMWIDKAQTWTLAQHLGGGALVRLIVEYTHTCYLGDHIHKHEWGYGCGQCPACVLRAEGWQKYRHPCPGYV